METTSGRNRHAAGLQQLQDAFKARPFDAHGLPRLSFLHHGSGNDGPIDSDCSSVKRFCRFFMAEVQQATRLSHTRSEAELIYETRSKIKSNIPLPIRSQSNRLFLKFARLKQWWQVIKSVCC
jgi:hypothetical protein